MITLKMVCMKDLFSFKVDPFQIDSLLIIDTYSLEFPGYLNAPSIFHYFQTH